ncbi:MAG TPA: endonuclease MutS2 [Pyrinomonadaceae bacterium]|nr:endonuclease MutS2 [Pyrinomonadaceae bacterium]
MNQQSFSALEYDKLRALVRRYAQTPMGRTRSESLQPIEERGELERNLEAVAECAALRERGAGYSFADVADPAQYLAVLRIENAALEPLAMLDLANLIEQALSARLIILSEKENAPVLNSIVERVSRDLQRVSRRLQEKILPGGILDDRASPELARLRNDINRLRERIARSLESLMRNTESAVQDEYVTVRNDRYVIPVKADFRGRLSGVAHGFSSSGQTIFIEPLSTIEANNELQSLREAEERETARVLYDLTESLRWELPAIEAAGEAVSELDFINAKAAFLRDFDCVVPRISEDEILFLREARHPLLEENLRNAGREVVPLSFELSGEKPVMVISGANAGGKTVVLKTAGLLSLMALSGLPVPASDAQVPFYRSILADIGDHQSIAANLSTFTSHVSNIARMMEICEAPSLVLLDEVGTGTDPEEGSALGVAVVDHFRRNCGAHVFASTHYRGLKMYAANSAGVQNASVEFNEKTLQPTYRLRVGIAGISAGIEIARRFGIPDSVIETAKSNVDRSSLEAGEYLQNLRREVAASEDIRRAIEEERAAVAERYGQLERDYQKRETERRREFESELGRTVEEFDRQTKSLLETIEDKAIRAKIEKDAQARKAEVKRAMSAAVSRQVPPEKPETGTEGPKIENRPVSVGAKVRLKNFGSVGTVEKMSGDEAEVLVGVMRLREKVENLETISEEKPEQKGRLEKLQEKSKKSESNLRFEEENRQAELNLVGMRTDEAEDLLDKFLDNSYLSGFPRVRVIHGIGTGALKNFVHSFLKNHPHVSRYTIASQDEGGNGATVVQLKQ